MRPKPPISRSPKKVVWEKNVFIKISSAPHAGENENKFSFSSLTGRFSKNVHTHARDASLHPKPLPHAPKKAVWEKRKACFRDTWQHRMEAGAYPSFSPHVRRASVFCSFLQGFASFCKRIFLLFGGGRAMLKVKKRLARAGPSAKTERSLMLP